MKALITTILLNLGFGDAASSRDALVVSATKKSSVAAATPSCQPTV